MIRKKEGPRGVRYQVRVAARIRGQRIEKTETCATYNDARVVEARFRHHLAERKDQAHVPPRDTTFDAVADSYLAQCRRRNARNTIENKEKMLDAHLRGFFGKLEVGEIGWSTTRAYRTHQKTFKHDTITLHLELVRAVLYHAKREGLIEGIPELDLEPRGVRAIEDDDCLTAEELDRLIEVAQCEPFWHALVLCLARLGLRRGEAIGLQWTDIKWRHHMLVVRRTYSRGQIGPLKARKRLKERKIKLPRDLRDVLKQLPRHNEWIFWDVTRNALVPEHTVLGKVVSLGRKAGLQKHVHPHKLRHTFASIMLMRGTPPIVVASWLGHSLKILQEVYFHCMDDEAGDYMDRGWAREMGATP